MQRFLSTPLFRAHRDKSRTKLVCEASALVQASRRKRPIYRSFCKKSLLFANAPKPAGRGARGRECRKTGILRRSGYLGGRRWAGRRRRRSAGRSAGRWRSPCEAFDTLRFLSFSPADVKTPEFRTVSISVRTEVFHNFDRPPWKKKGVKA